MTKKLTKLLVTLYPPSWSLFIPPVGLQVLRESSKPDEEGEGWNRYAAVVQLNTTQPLAHQFPSKTWERIGRVKTRKLIGWGKESLIRKRNEKKKYTEVIACHLPQVDWCPASLHAIPASSKCPSTQFLFLNMTLYGIEYPFRQSDSAVQVVSPRSFLPSLGLLTAWGRVGKKEGPDAVQVLLSNCQNTGYCSYQHCFSHKSRTHHHTGGSEEN